MLPCLKSFSCKSKAQHTHTRQKQKNKANNNNKKHNARQGGETNRIWIIFEFGDLLHTCVTRTPGAYLRKNRCVLRRMLHTSTHSPTYHAHVYTGRKQGPVFFGSGCCCICVFCVGSHNLLLLFGPVIARKELPLRMPGRA